MVSIIMGSTSDMPLAEKTQKVLDDFSVEYDTQVLSAHRMPKRLVDYVSGLRDRGYKVVICIAGLAAHLPGVVAAHTALPVIGVPVGGGPLSGIDALLSIAQMPKGVPVATMAIGSHGATTAALFAIRIKSLQEPELADRLDTYIEEMNNR